MIMPPHSNRSVSPPPELHKSQDRTSCCRRSSSSGSIIKAEDRTVRMDPSSTGRSRSSWRRSVRGIKTNVTKSFTSSSAPPLQQQTSSSCTRWRRCCIGRHESKHASQSTLVMDLSEEDLSTSLHPTSLDNELLNFLMHPEEEVEGHDLNAEAPSSKSSSSSSSSPSLSDPPSGSCHRTTETDESDSSSQHSEDDCCPTRPLVREESSAPITSQGSSTSTATTASENNNNHNKKKKAVGWGTITVHSHSIQLGDNVCSSGPPVTISWRAFETQQLSVNEYEQTKPQPRNKSEMLLPRHVREELLRKAGISRSTLHAASEQAMKIQLLRQRSSKDGQFQTTICLWSHKVFPQRSQYK